MRLNVATCGAALNGPAGPFSQQQPHASCLLTSPASLPGDHHLLTRPLLLLLCSLREGRTCCGRRHGGHRAGSRQLWEYHGVSRECIVRAQ